MKSFKLTYLVLALALVVFGCNEPGSDKIFELSFVELDAATTASGSRIYSYLRQNDGINKTSGFKVNLASKPLSQDVQLGFEILSTSTAIANVHYTVANQVVVIPAGQNIAELPIEIIADNIEAGEQLTINIRITGDANVSAMTGLDEASHIIQITCNSDIGGTYDSVADGTVGDGSGGSGGNYTGLPTTVTFTKQGATTYEVDDMSFGLYPLGYGDTAPAGRVTDTCDAIADMGDTDQYGDPFTIAGTRSAADGVINLTWSNTWGDSGNVTLTPQ